VQGAQCHTCSTFDMTARCASTAPFGRPVVPLVYIWYASSASDTGTAGAVAGCAASHVRQSCQPAGAVASIANQCRTPGSAARTPSIAATSSPRATTAAQPASCTMYCHSGGASR
jgi:hypothetical protein